MARADPDLDIATFGYEADVSTPRWQVLREALVRDPRRAAAALGWRLTGKRLRARNIVRSIAGDRLKVVEGAVPPVEPPSGPLPSIAALAKQPGQSDEAFSREAGAMEADIIAFQREGAVVSPENLRRMAWAFARDPNMLALYTDEIVEPAPGQMPVPLFKPDFDEEMLLASDYIGAHLAVRRDVFKAFGGLDGSLPGSALRALALSIADVHGASAVGHLAIPAYRWRGGGQPAAAGAKLEARLRCSETHLKRQGVAAACAIDGDTGIVRVRRALPSPAPMVSVIIPTRDRLDLLRPCIQGILQLTDYPELEIIVADNGSEGAETHAYFNELLRDRRVIILPVPGLFNFSRINNQAAAMARGELLAFLNNDIEVLERGWLKAMAAHAARREIGAVGAKLLYPDGKVQHGGVVLGIGGIAAHAHQFFPGDHPGYMHRLRVPQHYGAVTAACLVVAKRKFLDVGGFDEDSFPVSLNDVDLCLKLETRGWRSLWTPEAVLLHKEGASRRRDRLPGERQRWLGEVAALKAKWPERLAYDPAYNINLGQADADFAVVMPAGGSGA